MKRSIRMITIMLGSGLVAGGMVAARPIVSSQLTTLTVTVDGHSASANANEYYSLHSATSHTPTVEIYPAVIAGPQTPEATITLTHVVPGQPVLIRLDAAHGSFIYAKGSAWYTPNALRQSSVLVTPQTATETFRVALPSDLLEYSEWTRPIGTITWEVQAGPPGVNAFGGFPFTDTAPVQVNVVAHYSSSAIRPTLTLTAPSVATVGHSVPVVATIVPPGAGGPFSGLSGGPINMTASEGRSGLARSFTNEGGQATTRWTPTRPGRVTLTAHLASDQIFLVGGGPYRHALTATTTVMVDPASGSGTVKTPPTGRNPSWHRMNPELTLNANVAPSATSPALYPLATLAPGTPVWLSAEWTQSTPLTSTWDDAPVHWVISRPQAVQISATGSPPNTALMTSSGGLPVAISSSERWVADRPGIYTVQAEWHGHWSVPMVLTVGLGALHAKTPWVPPSATSTGVVPLPAEIAASDPQDSSFVQNHITLRTSPMTSVVVYRPIQGWLPIAGTIPVSLIDSQASRSVTIQLRAVMHESHPIWDYTLPLTSTGHFAAELHIPWHGNDLGLKVVTNLNAVFTDTPPLSSLGLAISTDTGFPQGDSDQGTLLLSGQLANPAPAVSSTTRQDLASGEIPLNQIPALTPYARTAWTLWTQAPSPVAGVMAIANWVSERTAYNLGAYESNLMPPATGVQTLQAHLGLGENYAVALMTLYRSIGLPARLVTGYVRPSVATPWRVAAQPDAEDGDAWVEVQAGGQWWTIDPMADGDSAAPATFVTNAYTTHTILFDTSHDASEVSAGVNPT